MENLHVTFTVRVSDTEYGYQGQEGKAEVKMQLPRETLLKIQAGHIFQGALLAALENYDSPEEDEDGSS